MELTNGEIKEDILYHWDLYKIELNKNEKANHKKRIKHGLEYIKLTKELEKRNVRTNA